MTPDNLGEDPFDHMSQLGSRSEEPGQKNQVRSPDRSPSSPVNARSHKVLWSGEEGGCSGLRDGWTMEVKNQSVQDLQLSPRFFFQQDAEPKHTVKTTGSG